MVVDVDGSQTHGETMMIPAELAPDGAYWELVDHDFRYGDEGPWEHPDAPATDA